MDYGGEGVADAAGEGEAWGGGGVGLAGCGLRWGRVVVCMMVRGAASFVLRGEEEEEEREIPNIASTM